MSPKKKQTSVDEHFKPRRTSRTLTKSKVSVKDEEQIIVGGLTRIVSQEESYLSQQEIQDVNNTLRQFDMTMRYGPCVGISRKARWNRAEKFGLNPPQNVIDILNDEQYHKIITNLDDNLWKDDL